jgi:Protein of unknown function (DUF3108)
MNSQPERRRRGPGRAWLGVGLLAALAGALAGAAEEPAGLQPYRARYEASYRGIAGGDIENGLRRGTAPGQWIYESRAYPNLLGRIAVSPQAHERGVMEVTASGVRPLRFEFDDGSDKSAKDVSISFDWAAGRASGSSKGEPFDLAVPPGTQDTASVQAAMLEALLAGRAPSGFPILTGSKLRQYRYWSEGRARISTPYGEFDTVVWANQRDGSDRLTRIWHAPALGYVPVQAIQYRKGNAESLLRIVNFERP